MTQIVIDIETRASVSEAMRSLLERDLKPRGNLRDPAKIAQDIEEKKEAIYSKAALSPLTAEAAIFGWAEIRDGEVVSRGTLDAREGEEKLLDLITKKMEEMKPNVIVTFGGMRFDLPFLVARYMIRDVRSFPWPLIRGTYPQHVDLRELLGDGTLEQWAVAAGFLGESKTSKSADVPVMIASGDWDGAISHCAEDVDVTARLYQRLAETAQILRR